ncbi:MAG: DUF2065 family protein [Gammaproteobacteria bacterium]|nr:DUF2065 family protein [Gammaproteobacteria bacterium]
MAKVFWLALGLVMVIEGLFPALNPRAYRRMVQMMSERDDRTLRLIGLAIMIAGAFLIYIT